MGTNYYATVNKCEHYERQDQLHIGKSSAGWCFLLHVFEDAAEGPTSLAEWRALLGGASIETEYGDRVTFKEMMAIIAERKGSFAFDGPPPQNWCSGKRYASWNDYFEQAQGGHAERGPKGLVRSVASKGNCIRHGDGTWDLITGRFS